MKDQYRPSRWVGWLHALTWKQLGRKVLGVFLVLVGLFALFTPFSPGSWLALVGLEFLGVRFLLQEKLLSWARARPDSKVAKLVCRLMCVWERDPSAKREWRRLWKGREKPSPTSPQADDKVASTTPCTPCTSESPTGDHNTAPPAQRR